MTAVVGPSRVQTTARKVSSAALVMVLGGCLHVPQEATTRALYLDLHTLVDAAERDGWIVDSVRYAQSAEPALHSVCQADPRTRAALDLWLGRRLELATTDAESSRALKRTRGLLRYAETRVASDCPDWLTPSPNFAGVQGHTHRFVVMGETSGFATFVIDTHVAAIGGGGRALIGYGLDDRFTLALGADLAASGTFLPGPDTGPGFDAIFTIAFPAMLRVSRLSRVFDVTLAPVMRFERANRPFPPGARIELGLGSQEPRHLSEASYSMFFVAYEFHPAAKRPADSTIEAGTRLALDWTP